MLVKGVATFLLIALAMSVEGAEVKKTKTESVATAQSGLVLSMDPIKAVRAPGAENIVTVYFKVSVRASMVQCYNKRLAVLEGFSGPNVIIDGSKFPTADKKKVWPALTNKEVHQKSFIVEATITNACDSETSKMLEKTYFMLTCKRRGAGYPDENLIFAFENIPIRP